jgi:hypothetical protein
MGADARSNLCSRDAVERLPLPYSQTALWSSGVAPPVPVEAANGCVVSAGPAFDEVLARYQDAIYRYALHLIRNCVAAGG